MRTKQGVRLLFKKSPAIDRPTAVWMDMPQVVLPLTYFPDAQLDNTVSLYDTVRRGTPLATCEADPDAVVLSSVTGAVSSDCEVAHPLYGTMRCAVIDRLPADLEPEMPVPHPEKFTAEECIEAARRAHIIDETDGVPLAAKLCDWQQNGCDYLVADAVQVQPYESSAWAVLRDYAEQVWQGLMLAAATAGTERCHIAVCLSGARRRSLALRLGKEALYQTDSYYPVCHLVRVAKTAGLHTVTPRETVRRIGVQACLALYRALYFHEPHDRCTLTVAGNAVKESQNVTVPFGTTVQEILTRCGLAEDPAYLILGDSMTGVSAPTQDVPVLPGMTCVLAFTAEALRPVQPRTCIGCGLCVQACHKNLLPFEIARRYTNMHYERLASLNPNACDGCGACSFVCPCGINLKELIAEVRQNDGRILLDLEEDADA